ncbi:MAG: pyridoxal-phosphate dependent enzyme [Fibrobacter sp.]|nr:pyridoxal-phosphate dependent enzyme [Fibrobacter sp.]
MNYLNKIYSNLEKKLDFVDLGSFPTPVEKIDSLERAFGKSVFIKRDDLSGKIYGGNKVRKLEYLFGEIISKGYDTVLTSGAAGSNHALAVSAYSSSLKIKSILMLFAQPYNPLIPKNLLADSFFGSEIHYDETWEEHCKSIRKMVESYKQNQKPLYVIPPGGSSGLGTVGYVNAAFELRNQIDTNVVSEPVSMFVPLGTCGTAAGLILGMKASGIKSKLIAVNVVSPSLSNFEKVGELFESANRLLHDIDNRFPICSLKRSDIEVNDSYIGRGYGETTPEASFVSEHFLESDNIHLETVYSGKAFAAFYDEIKSGFGNNSLFWDTKSSVPLPPESLEQDFRKLPDPLHKYFEN